MKKLFFLLLAMMLPMMASAQENVNGAYYEKTPDGNYKVVKHPFGDYRGEITISSIVNGIKVTEIGDNAFFDNQNLTAVHLPITIEKIGVGAFGNCDNLHSIEIPENVNYIDAYAFGGIDNLTDVYCYANNLSLGEDIFYKTKVKGVTLHVPEALFQYYKKADQWKKIKNIEATTTTSWAVQQQEREIAEQKRIAEEKEREAKRIAEEQAKVRQEFINDSTLAAQGNVEAQMRMATKFENGENVAKDINKAIELYKKAGNQGNVKAQLHLGDVYSKGLGVDKDEKEAMEWYRKAAEAGNADGQYNLGSCYYYGIGTAKDIKTGMEWTNKAATQGHELAIARQEVYEEEYGSYWKSQDDWRIVFPNGQIVGHNKGEVRSILFTKDFIAQFIDWDDWDDFDSFNKVKEGKKLRPMNKSLQMIPLDMSSFEALSIQDKTKILKENIEIFILDGINVSVLNRKGDYGDLVGIYDKGKFVSAESIKAAEEKALNAKLASFTKRFGFNPDGKGAKQLITYGRSLSLLTEWYYFRRDHQCSYYFFNLHQDLGSQKRYGIYYAKDYYSNSGKRQGYIWVKGDRITSVEWNR